MCREELSSSSKARARDQVEGAGEVGEGKGAISVATEFELATGWVDGGVGGGCGTGETATGGRGTCGCTGAESSYP